MRRRTFLMAAGAAGCARDRRPRLNVYNWSNYVAPDTVPNFEREFGVRVRYGTYESNEEMMAKVLGGNSGWDVVFPTNNRIQPMRANGLLAPLRHEWLPNLGNLAERFRAPSWDSGLQWCVPYMWSGTGIAFQKKLGLTTWRDLWDAQYRGRMTMLDDAEEVLGAALKKLGWSLNTTDPTELRRAAQEAIAQKPLLRAYLNAEVRDQLVAGDVLAAQLWATTAAQAMEASADLAFAYPAEGFLLYADNAVILAESDRRELAHRFLNYLLRAGVCAAIVAASKTATANGAVPQTNPVLNPPPEVMARGQWVAVQPTAIQQLRDRLWTEIKSA